jgi:hypothetical protein
MVEQVPGWTPHVERSLKEVLYRFLEEVHCTKAALYLRLPSNALVLAVQYGFGRGDAPAARLEPDSPVVVASSELDDLPMVINRAEDAPAIAEHLGPASSAKALLAPLVSDGRLIGLVDARDKARQQPFDGRDQEQAAEIASSLAELVLKLGLMRSIAPAGINPDPDELITPLAAAPARAPAELLDVRALLDCLTAASEAVVRDRLHAVALTVVSGTDAATVVLGSGPPEESESAAIQVHQAKVLAGAGGGVPERDGWRVEWRRVRPGADEAPRPTTIVTDVPVRDGEWSLVLSAIAGEGSALPRQVVERLRLKVAAAQRLSSLRYARRSLARRLLQPGEKRYVELAAHSTSVSRLCWSMAHAAGLSDDQAELAAVAGLLHDVGMRELDYDRLYRLDRPGPEHRRAYRRHVLSGERLLRGVGLEGVADAVRSHHERWDGKGYPDRIGADEIPSLARMVHVAEVFDVLTSTSSYLPPIPQEQALATLRTAAGKQFDPDMVALLTGVLA